MKIKKKEYQDIIKDSSYLQKQLKEVQERMDDIFRQSKPMLEHEKQMANLFGLSNNFMESQARMSDILRQTIPKYDYQKELSGVFDFQNQLNQVQKTLNVAFQASIPNTDYQKILSGTLGFQNQLNESESRLRDMFRQSIPMMDYQKQISESFGSQDRFTELQTQLADMFQKSIAKFDNQKQIMQSLAFEGSLKGTRELLENILRKNNTVKRYIDAVSIDDWATAYDPINDNIVINGSGAIASDCSVLTKDEVQDLLEQIIGKTRGAADDRFEIIVGNLIAEIRALKNPLREKILTSFIFPLIVGLLLYWFTPMFDQLRASGAAVSKKELIKEINAQMIDQQIDKTILDGFRLVVARELIVRAKGTNRSKGIATLHFGQVVELRTKKKNWSLVLLRDVDDSTIIQGWVYSRYVKKLQ
jgi:hypothetical protein